MKYVVFALCLLPGLAFAEWPRSPHESFMLEPSIPQMGQYPVPGMEPGSYLNPYEIYGRYGMRGTLQAEPYPTGPLTIPGLEPGGTLNPLEFKGR